MKHRNLLVWVLAIGGVIARCIGLRTLPISLDETHILAFVQSVTDLSLIQIINIIWFEPRFPSNLDASLYALISALAGKWFGADVLSIRVISWVFSVIAIYLGYQVIRMVFRQLNPAVAMAISAWFPMGLFYAREGRPYAMVLAMSLAAVYFWLRFASNQRRKDYGLAVISCAVSLTTHYYSLAVWCVALGLIQLGSWQQSYSLMRQLWFGFFSAVVLALPGFWPIVQAYGGLPAVYVPLAQLNPINQVVDGLTFILANATANQPRPNWIYAIYGGLWLLPIVLSRHKIPVTWRPLALIWVLFPTAIWILQFFWGSQLVYYSRAWIQLLPLTWAVWYWSTQTWPRQSLATWTYRGIILAPVILSTALLANADRHHPDLSSRDIARAVTLRIHQVEQPGDRIVVHHWLLASYLDAYYTGPNHIEPILYAPTRAQRISPGQAADDLLESADQQRIVLVLNSLATHPKHDPAQQIRKTIAEARPLETTVECNWQLLCEEILVFGKQRHQPQEDKNNLGH